MVNVMFPLSTPKEGHLILAKRDMFNDVKRQERDVVNSHTHSLPWYVDASQPRSTFTHKHLTPATRLPAYNFFP